MSNKFDQTSSNVGRMYEKADESIVKNLKESTKSLFQHLKELDEFVKEEPYLTMSIGVLVGFGFGVVFSALLIRRRD